MCLITKYLPEELKLEAKLFFQDPSTRKMRYIEFTQ